MTTCGEYAHSCIDFPLFMGDSKIMNAVDGRGKRLLFFVTEDWYFVSHRLPIAIAAKNSGYDVYVVTRVRAHGDLIETSGIKLIPFEISRRSVNPFIEILTVYKLILIYRNVHPDLVHHVALKPVLYGAFAAYFSRVPRMVNAMAGLGILFSSRSFKAHAVRPIIKVLFRVLLNRKNSRVILQNPDDVSMMRRENILRDERIILIRGSGVDIEQFQMCPEPSGLPVVMLASRLLWDKGVGEFVEAAALLKSRGVSARFVIVGDGDPENPSSIPNAQLQAWNDSGVIEWWGRRGDMPSVLMQSHIVCLPSYYGEGVPKILIEAASCGRPIVTTDSPGCREIVQNGVNGILVPVRDPVAVADALARLIDSPEMRHGFGRKGRSLVESEFSLDKINGETLGVYRDLFESVA